MFAAFDAPEAAAGGEGGENGKEAAGGASPGTSESGGGGEEGASADAPLEPGPEIDFDVFAFQLSPTLFPLGVQSGDATADSALLWTQYSGPRELEVLVYETVGRERIREHFRGPAIPRDGGYVRMDATGLPPGRELKYVFLEVEPTATAPARSRIGRLVTAPDADGSPVVRFGASSCTRNNLRPYLPLAHAAQQSLDFFILAGDTTYNDGAKSIHDFRSKWSGQLKEPGYQALFQSTSHYATWDDHEVTNNWNGEDVDPELLATATDALFEHLAIRRNPDAENRLWRSHRWGRTLEVFLLDSRGERKPSTRDSGTAEYLSFQQLEWLKLGLLDSPATFKIVVNSVPITDFPHFFDFAAADRWEGYAAQREDLIDFIFEEDIQGVLFVSGDFHLASSQTVSKDGRGQSLREVLVGPAGQIPNPLGNELSLQPPQFDFASGQVNYTRFEADPGAEPPTVKIDWMGADGAPIYSATYAF